jgi:hypothetical protein
VRKHADMQNTTFVQDDEILEYLNVANGGAYNAVVKANEAYFITSTPVTITNSVGNLPATCYKLISVEAEVSGQTVTLKRFNFQERNRYNKTRFFYAPNIYRYCMAGNQLLIKPEDSNLTVTLWYVPYVTALVSGGSLDFPVANWDEYLVYSAAADCLAKEQSDPSVMLGRAASSLKDIESQVANRDESEPEQVVNVYKQNNYFE